MSIAFLKSPHNVAGLLSLFAALLVIAVWYIVLFVAPLSGVSLSESAAITLRDFLSAENPSRSWFVWLAVAPVVSGAVGLTYLFGDSRSKALAVTLLLVSVMLAVSGFYLVTWSLALFIALPSYWGFLCVRTAA